MTTSIKCPVHREGLPVIGGFVIAGIALSLLWAPLAWVAGPLALWSVWFFRDPDRRAPTIPDVLVSPADGRLLPIDAAAPPPELGMGPEPRIRLRIFMNVFDVHVNRVPADGTILETNYRPGRFVNASFDKASEENERLAVRMKLPTGDELAFVQIAGLIARRIRSTLRPGDVVGAGERFGLIRFGSRVDVYLPPGVTPSVRAGQRMRAGETVIAVAGTERKYTASERPSLERAVGPAL